MQKRKKNGKKTVRKTNQKDILIEEFLMEEDGSFDEEDEDSVTEDTLEFLSLDDEMIEAYNRKHGHAKKSRKTSDSRRANKKKQKEYEETELEAEEEEYFSEEAAYEEEYAVEDEDVVYEDEDEYVEEDEDAGYEEEYEYGEYDEEYEDEEEYEYDEYDDEDEYEEEYEYDDEYEDEEYEYDGYEEQDGVIVRIKDFFAQMSALDMVVAMLGIVVLAGAILSGGLYLNAKSVEKQVEAFASIGEEMAGISVIGESGLVAVSESARFSSMIGLEEEVPEEQEEQETEEKEEKNGTIEVTLNLTTIQSDLKIKFVNKATGKLIGGVPFEVEVSGKKSFTMKDDDKDGIIYQTGIAAGDYSVKILPFTDNKYADYKLPSSASSVTVKDTITYKKVDVSDEVKTEAEVNVAAEDTAQQNTVVESSLKDTVEWVESTKTPVEGDKATYTEVDKKNIPDPWTVSGAFMRMVNEGETGNNNEGELENNAEDQDKTVQPAAEINNDSSSEGGNNNPVINDFPFIEEDEIDVYFEHGLPPLEVGQTGSLQAIVIGTSASPVWTSSDTNVATVDSNGNVTAVGAGEAAITASVTVDGKTLGAKCTVTVKAPVTSMAPATSAMPKVTLSSTGLNLKKGETASLSIQGEMQSISTEWTSSNNSIVKLSEGNNSSVKVTAEGIGDATITAKVKVSGGNQDLVCSVKVQDSYTKITISGDAEVIVGKTITLTAVTEPKDGKITWSSNDDKIAKVDDKGVVTGVAEGTAEIKAVCTDATNVFAVHKVTVKKSKVDGTAKLKDKDGNQMYYLDASGAYKEATYDDYNKYDKFYKMDASAYKYTGWQTIDGSVYFFDKDGNYVTGEQVIQGAKYNFGSDGRMSSGSGSMGIDVSKWNGNIDWNAVKNSGVSYVIIRCGYRGSSTGALIEDPKFRSNINGAKAAGLKVGVYFFSQAVNEVEAVEEASMALSLASGYGLNYPIFLDVEASGGRGDGISKETRTAVCKAFCSTVQNSGCSAGIYANKTWFNEKINTGSLTGYKIWLAQYASSPTYTATRYDMWQYSSKGKVSGISGSVDMNISYLNY